MNYRHAPPGPSFDAALGQLEAITLGAKEDPSILLPHVELKATQFELQREELVLRDLAHEIETIAETKLPNFESNYSDVFRHKELQQKKFELSKRLSDEYLDNYPEYQSRLKVLKELKYIDEEDRGTIVIPKKKSAALSELLYPESLIISIASVCVLKIPIQKKQFE